MSDPHPHATDSESSQLPADALLNLGFRSKAESFSDQTWTSEKAGDVIGRYRLVAPLGEGGFGFVWKAEQTEPIRRELALKVIKPGMDSREIIARFEAERQALAMMDHPHIAAVLDAGTMEAGRPYFAMELVKGEPITSYCDSRRLSIRERLELFLPVCQAVQHAHQKSILHRDLKPSNILVEEVDAKPAPKVIDFGIAKALGGSESDLMSNSAPTQPGVVIGTPRYMSPEQAGRMPDVDTRSDVYSLGVILCELLTGQPPLPRQPVDFADALRSVRETEPLRPSALVQSITPEVREAAGQRKLDPTRFARSLRGDLDWITLKALEKDRARRYDTAAALARDLEHYLHNEPVSAVPPTWRYTLGKFARRRRGALVAANLIVAALIAGTVVSLWQASVATRNRREAERRYEQARDAVNKYLARVTDDPKLKQDNFENLRRDLLETAVPFFEDMGRYKGDDARLRSDRAWAIAKLGNLYRDTGQLEKAEAALREALDLRSKLAAQFPEDPQRRWELTRRHTELATVFATQGKWELVLEHYDECIKIRESLVARSPDDRDDQKWLASSLVNRGITLSVLDRYEPAIADLEKARLIQEKLAAQFPQDTDIRRDLGSNLLGRANLLRRMGQPEEPIPLYRKGLEIYDQLANETVNDHDLLQNRAAARMRLGQTLQAANRLAEAESVLRSGVDQFRAVVGKFPEARDHRQGLIRSLQVLMDVLRQEKKWPEADALLVELRQELDRMTANSPNDAWAFQTSAAVFCEQGNRALERQEVVDAQKLFQRALTLDPKTIYFAKLANIELSRGDYDSVLQQMQTLPQSPPGDWLDDVQQAEILVKVLPLIEADTKLEAAARDKLLESSSARTVQLLKKAIAGGYSSMTDFDRPRQAASLRRRTDYQALLQPGGTPPPLPAKPPASPQKFTFDYKYEDPGPRRWALNGTTWTETQPSGSQNTFVVIGHSEVNGVRGTLIERQPPRKGTLFVPDIGAETPLRLRVKTDSEWVSVGTITDAE